MSSNNQKKTDADIPPSVVTIPAGPARRASLPCARVWRLVGRLAALTLIVWAAGRPATMHAEGEGPLIASATDFWGYANTPGDLVHPLKARITVNYYDSDWNVLWAEWDGVGCYLPPGTRPLRLKSGMLVELDGFTRPGRQEILWDRTTIRVIDEAVASVPVPLPDPLDKPIELNLRIVTLTGLVCEQIDLDGTHTRLFIALPGHALTAQVYVPLNSPIPQFRGAFVRMHGVFSVKEDIMHRTSELEMWVTDVRNVEVVSWLSQDTRFDAPAVPMEQLPDLPGDGLVRVQGVVYRTEPGASVTLRDDTGEVRVLTCQTDLPKPGTQVEAIGHPEVAGVETRLSRGIVRIRHDDTGHSGPIANIAPPPLKLRLTEHVRSLDPEAAERGSAVDLRGVVTWTAPGENLFFIMDSTGGIEVGLPGDGSVPMPEFGTDVIVRGATRSGKYVPTVRASEVKPALMRTLPPPHVLNYDLAMSGSEYGDWAEIRGYVRSVAPGPGDTSLLGLTTAGGVLLARVRGLESLEDLPGALVSIRGVCDATVNERRQLTSVVFLVASPELVTIEQPAPEDIFDATRRSIGSLLQFGAARDLNHRVLTSGTVSLHRAGNFLYLEDGGDRLLVLSRQTEPLQPGDRVEAVGFPGHEAGRLVMRDAVFRKLGPGPAPSPQTIDDTESPRLEWDGMTVSIRGRLLDHSQTDAGSRLRIKNGPSVFEARLPPDERKTFEAGSELVVKGVYRVQFDEYRQPRSFVLDLHSALDVAVLSLPPWWTSSRMLWAGGALLAIIMVTGGAALTLARKNRLLREADQDLQLANAELETRVSTRTLDLQLEVAQRKASEEALATERRLLRTLIDNLPVFLYVKNTEGQFVIGNLPHARLLGVTPEAEVIGKTDRDIHPPELADRYERDDRSVLETGKPLVQIEEPSSIHGKSGWFSTTKVPLRNKEGRIYGLIGISQDITGRKKAEAERAELQRQLVESSRLAGMAEVATGVLHNVGNVLNSVNVSTGVIRDTLRRSEVATLARVAGLLREHESSLEEFLTKHPKGRLLPRVIMELAEHIEREHAGLRKEQEHLAQNIDHVKGIVAMQQSFAKASGVLEIVRVADVVNDALNLHTSSLVRHGIEITCDFEDLPPMLIDRHKIIQILVNLFTNAKHAIDESRRTGGCIRIRIAGSGEDMFAITVTDNGVGIAREHLVRIFSHGFTTRAKGHGFGLQSGANAAREMGGSLHVHSDGPGTGATFTLELPANAAKTAV